MSMKTDKSMKTNVSKSLIKAILKTKKQFILYNLTDDKSKVLNYRLSDEYELTGNNKNYSNFKVDFLKVFLANKHDMFLCLFFH